MVARQWDSARDRRIYGADRETLDRELARNSDLPLQGLGRSRPYPSLLPAFQPGPCRAFLPVQLSFPIAAVLGEDIPLNSLGRMA